MSKAHTHWLDRFSISKQLWLLISSFVAGLLILGGLITSTLREVQVSGPIYKQVVDGKDLVADILPPPAYLIESWQVALELASSVPGAEQDSLLSKSVSLRKDFEAREAYWKDILPTGSLRDTFLDGAYPAGKAFLDLRDQEFIPAIKRHDMASAQTQLPRLKSLYLAHRAKIDQVVTLANQRVSSDEKYAHEVISSRTIILLISGGVLLVLLVWLGNTIAKQVIRNLGGDVRLASSVVAKVADGDLDSTVPVMKGDQQSLMYNLQRMQATLRDAQKQAVENARIRRALDSVSSNVRITDPNGMVLYANHQLLRTVESLSAGIRRRIPEFQPSTFVGMDITRFYDNPEAVRSSLQQLRGDRLSTMDIGGRMFEVKTTPVFDDQQVLIGTIGEWHDQTDLLRVQSEVQAVIEAAKHGDYSQRVVLEGKEGFFHTLSASMNSLLDSTEKALAELAAVLSSLAQGDLTVRMESDFDGMLAQLKNDCNRTIDQLAEIVEEIAASTLTINTAAREISSGNADLSSRTERQAASIEETAASMEELTGTVKQNAENAKQANLLATGASEVAIKGGKVVGDVVSTMEDINQSARKIVDIISVIDGIAFQTNILALNAAVEAARAGEQGKGFAVVASEVRSLAQRSAGAAKEIKALINDSVSKTESGSRLVNDAGQTIGEVVTAVKRVTDIVGEISQASVEQSAGIQQVSQTVTQMDDATQQNATLVEEASAAATSLREQAENLQGLVRRFRLSSTAATSMTLSRGPRGDQAKRATMKTLPSSVRQSAEDDEWSTF